MASNMNNDELLFSEKLEFERKTFYVDLKENARGKVIKITEECGNNRDTIMVPAEELEKFIQILEKAKKEV